MDRKTDPLDQSRGKVDLRPRVDPEALTRALLQIEASATNREYIAPAVDVAHIRKRMGMTQVQFARRFGFAIATLRHWEHGDRKPAGAALAFLNVIARNPRAVLDALRPRT